MKPHEISIMGQVGNDGRLLIANKAEMNDFFNKWPNTKVIMSAKVYSKEGSKSLIGYYMAKVVPDFQIIMREQQGEFYTLSQMDLKLREWSPIAHEEIESEEAKGFDLIRLKTVYEMEADELVEYVNHILMIAGRDYGYNISSPN
jgi:hypothetical protein